RTEEEKLLDTALSMSDDCELAVRATLHANLARTSLPPLVRAEHADLALQFAQDSGDARALVAAYFAKHEMSAAHDGATRLALAHEARSAATSARDPELEIEAALMQYIAATQIGDTVTAASARARQTALSQRLGQPFYFVADIAIRARELLAAGDLSGAEQ